MYIAMDDEITPRGFAVYKFYGIKTCFCWDTNSKLIMFPYEANDNSARDVRVLSTPAPVQRIQCFNDRIFLICAPQGIYKLSRAGVFAVLSKNALAMGAEYCEVLIAKKNGIYLDNKQIKSSRLLFQYPSNASEEVYTFPLIYEETEERFFKYFIGERQAIETNICMIGYGRRLYALISDAVQLIYTSDDIISTIASVRQGNKVAALLLLNVNLDTVILIHGKNCNLIFEKVYLGRNIRNTSAFCATFSLQLKNILWLVYCDQNRLYYMKKELFINIVQEAKIENKTFLCIQHYQSNVILGLSEEKKLIEISLETLENSLTSNNNISLHTNMFQRTDLIMEKICSKAKELDILYEKLADGQDKLRRINLYACKRKLLINPHIEISRLWNYHYLTLSITEKLPKNSYIVFTFVSKTQNIFCMKKVTETEFTIRMLINRNKVLYFLNINMDLVTLMNEEAPWCLIKNIINCPLQNKIKRRGSKKDKTAFINTKITLLQNLIAERDLDMIKLREIKKIVRTEL